MEESLARFVVNLVDIDFFLVKNFDQFVSISFPYKLDDCRKSAHDLLTFLKYIKIRQILNDDLCPHLVWNFDLSLYLSCQLLRQQRSFYTRKGMVSHNLGSQLWISPPCSWGCLPNFERATRPFVQQTIGLSVYLALLAGLHLNLDDHPCASVMGGCWRSWQSRSTQEEYSI